MLTRGHIFASTCAYTCIMQIVSGRMLSIIAGGAARSIIYIHYIVLDKGALPLNSLYKIITSTNTLIQS